MSLELTDKEKRKKEFWKEKRKRRRDKKKEETADVEKQHWREGLTEEEIEQKKQIFRKRDLWKYSPIEDLPYQKPIVVIDLSFTDQMNTKEIRSVLTQLSSTYGFIRKFDHPLELHLCSFDGIIKDCLENLQGFGAWKIYLHKEACQYLYSEKDLVYLSPDAEEELTTIEESKVYIIGGIVDHNRLKVGFKVIF